MNIIACRRNNVGLAVAGVATELHIPCSTCGTDHAQNADGILFLTSGDPARVGAETLRDIGEHEKPALIVSVGGQDAEFVRKWIARKNIQNLFVTGNASAGASRRFMRSVIGAVPPPRPRWLAGLLARIFCGGWRCRALELE